MRKWWSGGLAAILLLVGALLETPGLTAQARGTSGASFTLAVLRRDGVVIPIASYGGGRWSNRWPAPGRKPDIPISVSDSPKGWWADKRPISEWTAWPMRGDSRVIHVTSAVNLTVECQPQVGLQTDYVSAEPAEPPKMQPYPKDGLATSGDLLVEPVALLDARSKEWAAVSADVDARVTMAESALFKDAHYQAFVPDRDRASTLFSLEVLFGGPGPQPGTTVLYLEGVKRYAPRPGPPSGVLTYAAGFVLLEPSGPPQVEMNATLSDRRREGLVYSLVLGSFRLDGRLFWVVQRSAWGYERFDIFEIRDGKVTTVFKSAGGTC